MFKTLSPFLKRDHGILGLNARSLLYIRPYNPKVVTKLADDKLKTKAFLTARGIPAAKIYARIETREQARSFDFSQLPDECVLKPNYGFGGEGILIFKGRKKGCLLKSGKEPYSDNQIVGHVEDILDGKFSLGGRKDTAFFEQILYPHECFARFRPSGLPDLRIIVFNLVPVMAMLRIPTKESDGKANVHLGGIGIGIDIAKGTTTHAAQYHHMITKLPHGESVSGIPIPYWDEILLICSRIQQQTNIGYLACDITIDQNMGPALLEVNARAGLMVQVANLAPLHRRLKRVQGIKVSSPEKGVRLGQDLFGQKVRSADIKSNEKPVLGLYDRITIAGDGSSIEESCAINPSKDRTIFSPDLIKELEELDALDTEDTAEKTYRAKFTLCGKKIQTLISESTNLPEGYRVSIGRRDLSGFLIDPSAQKAVTNVPGEVKRDIRALDRMLEQADKELLILKYLKPVNLEEERKRIDADPLYNPLFQYREPPEDLDDIEQRLSEKIQDTSAIGLLLEKKRVELLKRITLLRARGDSKAFTAASVDLFGKPSSTLVRAASAYLHHRRACLLPAKLTSYLNAKEAAEKMKAVLDQYSLHDWNVVIRSKLVANCTVGGGNVYIREDAEFDPMYLDGLIKHEIETHVLTAENGDHQPYAILRRGCANYLDTQEGLAVYNQNRVYGEFHDRRYYPPKNVLGVAYGLEHSFAETRKYLKEEVGFSEDKSVSASISLKRGLSDTSEDGAFTKGICYFRGLRAIEKFVADGGKIEDLYIGKIAVEDIDIVKKVQDLTPPLLLPEFLQRQS